MFITFNNQLANIYIQQNTCLIVLYNVYNNCVRVTPSPIIP